MILGRIKKKILITIKIIFKRDLEREAVILKI
jgi:hypothetical protein